MKPNLRRSAVERNKQRTRVVTAMGGLLFAGVLAVSSFFDEMGVPKYFALRERAEQLQGELRDLKNENAALKTELGRLEHDPVRIEELARERLGFVRKGETVYQIVGETMPNGRREGRGAKSE
jgi:cell division protein FtsB